MARLNDVYASAFIKANKDGTIACDISHGDYELTLTIKSAVLGKVGQGDDERAQVVLHFEETEQTLGLNVTNARAIEAITGTDEYDTNWVGHKIELFVVPEQRSPSGQAIRVRKPRPVKGAPAAPYKPPAVVFGDAAATRLIDASGKAGKDIADCRAYLTERGVTNGKADVLAGAINGWPREWAEECGKWLKLPVDRAPALQVQDESDIPF